MFDVPELPPALPATPPATPAFTPAHTGDVPGAAAALGAALSAALAAATVRPGDGLAALHDAVAAYARALRAAGAPPEAAVIAVKHAIEAADVCRYATPDDLEFAARVVTWGIEAYFGAE
jgi:hypothetical protein